MDPPLSAVSKTSGRPYQYLTYDSPARNVALPPLLCHGDRALPSLHLHGDRALTAFLPLLRVRLHVITIHHVTIHVIHHFGRLAILYWDAVYGA